MGVADDCRRILRGHKLQIDPFGTKIITERFETPAVVRRRLSDAWNVDESQYRLGQAVIKSPGLVTVSFCLMRTDKAEVVPITQKEFRYFPNRGQLMVGVGIPNQTNEDILPASLEAAASVLQQESSTGVTIPSEEEKQEFHSVITNRAAEMVI